MHLLVTGGCGFIGSHFIRHCLDTYKDARVTNLDALTYAAHPNMTRDLDAAYGRRYQLLQGDIASIDISRTLKEDPPSAIVNFAAETHVDRSILDPGAFVRTNIVGVENLVRQAREAGNIRFVHVSTDEVYGTLAPNDPTCTETTPLDPNSPYAASKAAADLLLLATFRTYGQPILITRCTNNYGPYQFPEKLIPLLTANALENLPVPVYGDGLQVRDWIHVVDHCRGIDAVLQKGTPGQVYNISASAERPNIEVVKLVLKLVNRPESLIKYVGDRPAHDRRYGLNAEKIRRELGWEPKISFAEGIAQTIDWYRSHEAWWKQLRDKKFYDYYSANYSNKFTTGVGGKP